MRRHATTPLAYQASFIPARPAPAPPVPPLPPSPAMHSLASPVSPPPISRSSSSSSSSSSSQRVSTPPPRRKSRPVSSGKLLPALPLSVDTQIASPNSKRTGAIYSPLIDSVQIVVEKEDTPPRPRRSSIRPSPRDLQPPVAPFRSTSPSGDSISTVSDVTPTARSIPISREIVAPTQTLASAIDSAPMGRKRDSAQRRLSALKGLVANLDFNQPWSQVEAQGMYKMSSASSGFFWACGDPQEADETPISDPMPFLHDVLPDRPRNHRPVPGAPAMSDHGWPEPLNIDVTPVRQTSLSRKPNSTPPRRPRLAQRDMHLTPEPRPRQRREVFDVASSGYSKSLEPSSPGLVTPTSTWRSSLTNDETYRRVLAIDGPLEVKRQEIIWEMCETEHAFVKSMRTVLRLFAIPLKTPQGKWIDGIPSRITELFDCLEGVAHAHGTIATTQRDMRRRTEVFDLQAFVAMFKAWVAKLEVHEWYLLRFEAVVQLVEDNVRDPESVFGEFVRMQMKEEVLGSMSLGSMLLKPVQRLTKYPLFLKRLLDVTPHPHPAHPEILSLLSTTESIILTLQASKAREDDLEQLQSLESRLHGLPDGFTLAVRGRKLVGHGQVVRVHKDLPIRGRAGSLHSSRGSISSTVSSSAPSSATSSSPWDFSATLTPSTCRTSAFSVTSSSSSCAPSRSNSLIQTSPSSATSPARSPSVASNLAQLDRPTTPSSQRTKQRKEDVLTMYIFDDLVLVAAPISERGGLFKKKGGREMRVLSEAEGGIGKVAEVRDWSGWGGHATLFSLTLYPQGSVRNPIGVTNCYTIPVPSSPKSTAKTGQLKRPVLSSLQSFIATLGQVTDSGPNGVLSGVWEVEGEDKEVLRGETWDEGVSLGWAQ
ncbi:hypothetical protein BCR39DRAFT_554891 [Naematelia encephala]|uniref:DH domain-containing protein n=1 Tax=Naematelia encephala TaxID=71784 RepID=A0A1Y2AEL4_9TREE|nr:hypothetical protein BCR39DRAFT_554891 [Naematelia encephala]